MLMLSNCKISMHGWKFFFPILLLLICTNLESNASGLKNKTSKVVYGSVLNSDQTVIKVKPPSKLFNLIRKDGVYNMKMTLTKIVSPGEKTEIYVLGPSTLPKISPILRINIFKSLKDISGNRLKASSLPEGKYKLTIQSGKERTSVDFEYKPPVVINGKVTFKNGKCPGGTNQITDVSGKPLSGLVAISRSTCTYINEIQSKPVGSKSGKRILNQTQNKQIAISKIISSEGILSAPVEINSNNNIESDVDSDTTNVVDNAIGLIKGGAEDLSEEDLNLLEGVFADFFNEEDLQFVGQCDDSSLSALYSEPSENPTDEELISFGKKIAGLIKDPNSNISGCFPAFVSGKILPFIESQGDEGYRDFALGFIGNKSVINGGDLCSEFNSSDFQCNAGENCLPVPCLPDDLKNELNAQCPNLSNIFNNNNCIEPVPLCLTDISPGFRLQQANAENDQCVDLSNPFPQEISLCSSCQSDSDCTSSGSIDNCSSELFCQSVSSPDGKSQKLCVIKGAIKDPFTCEEVPFDIDPEIQCFGFGSALDFPVFKKQ